MKVKLSITFYVLNLFLDLNRLLKFFYKILSDKFHTLKKMTHS